jgi:hypothetical protein
MVARTSLISELVLATIKFGMAPLKVGPEYAANFYVQMLDNILKECFLLNSLKSQVNLKIFKKFEI